MTNTQIKITDNYKCLNSLLSKNIANVVINYCPTFYVQHCLKRKRETKIEIGMLQQQLYKKQKFVKQYEEQLVKRQYEEAMRGDSKVIDNLNMEGRNTLRDTLPSDENFVIPSSTDTKLMFIFFSSANFIHINGFFQVNNTFLNWSCN